MKNLIGKKFGRLTLIQEIPSKDRPSVRKWLCRCECGKYSRPALNNVTSGKQVSCGCYQKEIRGISSITHGRTRSAEYRSWLAMKARCNNKKYPLYKDYGGRGIKVCERWNKSFVDFLNDMGEKPSLEYAIDRINNDGNYEPSNCKWSTRIENNNNKRDTNFVIFKGEKISIPNLARRFGLKIAFLRERIIVQGWDVERAVTQPKMKNQYI